MANIVRRRRYTVDADGQWWYRFGGQRPRKTRAALRRCLSCERQFPTWRDESFCSRRCVHAARRDGLSPSKRACNWCGGEYESSDSRQRYCGHVCAAAAMHARRPQTTKPDVRFKNADNPNYRCDENGQWWFLGYGAGKPRTRAIARVCGHCHEPFLSNIFTPRQRFCSRECALLSTGGSDRPAGFNWKGGRHDKDGYVRVYHIGDGRRRYVYEHRLVMERKLGRPLLHDEEPHHKNGIRDDNRPENLELWLRANHRAGPRVEDLITYVVTYHRDAVLAALGR